MAMLQWSTHALHLLGLALVIITTDGKSREDYVTVSCSAPTARIWSGQNVTVVCTVKGHPRPWVQVPPIRGASYQDMAETDDGFRIEMRFVDLTTSLDRHCVMASAGSTTAQDCFWLRVKREKTDAPQVQCQGWGMCGVRIPHREYARLTCLASGYPRPTVTWTFKGIDSWRTKVIDSSQPRNSYNWYVAPGKLAAFKPSPGHRRSKSKVFSYHIDVNRTQSYDNTGIATFEVSNALGTVKLVQGVVVSPYGDDVETHVDRRDQGSIFRHNNELTLRCLAYIGGHPNFTWYFTRKDTYSRTRIRETTDSEEYYRLSSSSKYAKSTLLILNSNLLRDAGKYECVVSNEYGCVRTNSIIVADMGPISNPYLLPSRNG